MGDLGGSYRGGPQPGGGGRMELHGASRDLPDFLHDSTLQDYRCPEFTDKNGDGICDNMILGAASKSSGSPSSYSTPTSAGKYKTGVSSGLIGLAAVLATVGAYLTFRG